MPSVRMVLVMMMAAVVRVRAAGHQLIHEGPEQSRMVPLVIAAAVIVLAVMAFA